MESRIKLKSFVFSLLVLAAYLSGITSLSSLQGAPWSAGSAFWVGIIHFPLGAKIISGITIMAGTALIYFIPGIFIAKSFSHAGEGPIEIFLKGFLVNYGFYFFSSTLYKAIFGQEFSREVMILLMGAGILIMGTIFLWETPKSGSGNKESAGGGADSIKFTIFYLVFAAMVVFIFREKIFLAHFGGDGDGAEQYWLAHSVKSGMLPTSYRSLYTLLPQFAFAPSVYLNMFAMVLFGNAEFIIKIEILTAFLGLGYILRGLVRELRGERQFGAAKWIPLLLYLFLFFIIIAYRAAYLPPTDLAKSNETVQLALYLSGFYLLIQRNKDRPLLAAVFFVLAAMIRYNGFLMITIFLVVFSLLFKRHKALLWYLAGCVLVIALLSLALLFLPLKFMGLIGQVLTDLSRLGEERFSFNFCFSYLKNYLVFTSGLSLFFILGWKNRYVVLMFLTSIVYLIMPFWSDCVPAVKSA